MIPALSVVSHEIGQQTSVVTAPQVCPQNPGQHTLPKVSARTDWAASCGRLYLTERNNSIATDNLRVDLDLFSKELFHKLLFVLLVRISFCVLKASSGSSGRVEGAEKHEIYVASFGSHPRPPLDPLLLEAQIMHKPEWEIFSLRLIYPELTDSKT